jgi:thiol-disulfide isomerase/thioredoxin
MQFEALKAQQFNVGRRIPDFSMNGLYNFKSANATISQFKGKLIILDFWATYCAPCVGMFPKADSLQHLFNDKVQFIAISKEGKNKVESFLRHLNDVRHIRPVALAQDTLFSNHFYYATIPYYVWINVDGKIIGATDADEITAENIRNILAGKQPTFANRSDIRRRKIDINHSAFVVSDNFLMKDSTAKREELPGNDLYSYSIATKAVNNVGGSLRFDTTHFAVVNVTIEWLFRWYYNAFYYNSPVQGAFDSNRNHVFDIKDTTVLNRIVLLDDKHIKAGSKAMDDWIEKNTVCYEIRYPTGLSWKQKGELVKQDLDRYFGSLLGFYTYVEQRIDTNVYVLTKNPDFHSLNTQNTSPEERHDRYSYFQNNMPISRLIGILNSYFFQDRQLAFVDDSKIISNVNLNLECDMTNINSINDALRKLGLQFIKSPEKIDVLIFKDKIH